jgi:glycosyltransferase involved in cell wall biosynthesis
VKVTPTISVVMSVYNGGPYLRQSIESILNQTWRDFEFIIVDDGSTDDTARIIGSFQDERIILLSQTNQGLQRSLNRGIKRARGRYVARHDSDDMALPRRLSIQLAFLKRHPQVSLLGTNLLIINSDGEIIGRDLGRATDDLELKWRLLFSNPFAHPSVMIRREAFDDVGLYSESRDYRYIEDYELWSRIGKRYQIANLREPLVQYRNHLLNISNEDRNRQFDGACLISSHNVRSLASSPGFSDEEIAWLITFHSIPMRLTYDQIIATLHNVEELFYAFSLTHSVGPVVRKRLWFRIRTRLATFLLEAAVGHCYAGNDDLAKQLALRAVLLNPPTLFCSPRYWALALKLCLGRSASNKLRRVKYYLLPGSVWRAALK